MWKPVELDPNIEKKIARVFYKRKELQNKLINDELIFKLIALSKSIDSVLDGKLPKELPVAINARYAYARNVLGYKHRVPNYLWGNIHKEPYIRLTGTGVSSTVYGVLLGERFYQLEINELPDKIKNNVVKEKI